MKNALIIHGGAPTAVMNASLYGAVREAQRHPEINKIFGAIGGTGGVLRESFIDLNAVPEDVLELLPYTPASAIGTSRDRLKPEDYKSIAYILHKHEIHYVFFNGGNGSMDTCGKVFQACQAEGIEIQVVGISKTIDNDLACTDHAPGFGSAARYIAATVSEISIDVRSLPIHVCIIETMGRNAGWLTAASALARTGRGDGPDLIYLPERPFVEEDFLREVQALHKKQGGVVVVASEGLKTADGKLIVEPIFEVDRSVYYGDVGAHLANLVIRRLGIKARNEKPGICARSSIAHQSSLDRQEAILAGEEAVKAAINGQSGVMVAFERLPGSEYRVQTVLVPIQKVMLTEQVLPHEFIHPNGHDVTTDFIDWCRPLLGGPLAPFAMLDI